MVALLHVLECLVSVNCLNASPGLVINGVIERENILYKFCCL